MSFDLVYKEIGDWGRYQKYVILLGWITSIYGGLIFINSVFLLYVPDHRCALPGYDNDTYEVQNEAHQLLINRTIPISSDGTYDKCHLYTVSGDVFSNSTAVPCNAWVFDTSTFTSTLGAKVLYAVLFLYAEMESLVFGLLSHSHEVWVKPSEVISGPGSNKPPLTKIILISSTFTALSGSFEMPHYVTLLIISLTDLLMSKHIMSAEAHIWEPLKLNLVCDRAILKSSAQMIFFGGVLIGSFLSGMVSDRFGRKPTMCVSVVLLLVAAISVAWTPSIEIYMFLSASVGCLCVGFFMPVFVVSMEFVGPSKRIYAGQFGAPFWTMGNMLMTLTAYYIRDWSTFQIICAVPGIFFLSYWVLFPESPRWLFTQGRLEESKAIIEKAASWNKVKLSDDLFDSLALTNKIESKVMFLSLFSSRTLAIRTLVLYVNWIAVCMAYYGLAINSDGLGSEKGIHLYFLLQSLMDIPAFLLVTALIDRVGRRILLITCMLVGGTACIATMFLTVYGGKDTSSANLALALVGKLGAACGFALVYQYSAELFPTVVRNAGMGSCSCMARIGGIICPFVADSPNGSNIYYY